ncbi:MAG: murein hydrolase activator EnvC family protein [Chloroflexota bacterium]
MKLHRLPAILLAAALILQPAVASADTLTDLRTRIAHAQTTVQQLTARRLGQQGIVEQLRGIAGAQSASLRQVDAELISAVTKFRQAEAALERVDVEIVSLEAEIAAKELAVSERANVYGTRLRALYKFTRTSPLEQLLAARSFTDAIHRITMMQAVTRVDNRLLGQLRDEHDDLVQNRATLAEKRSEAVALRAELDTQRQTVEMRRAEQARLVAQAQGEQRSAEGALSQLDQAAAAQVASIQGLQLQYQKELVELERLRAEELRRQEALRLAAVATETAQAQVQATAQARSQTTLAAAAKPSVTPTPLRGVAATRPPIVSLPGSIQTDRLQPSAYNMVYPVTRPVITTEYGERTFAQSFHTGIDLAQNTRTPVLAAADGAVLESGLAVPGKPEQSYGMTVVIGHDTKLSTRYAHLDAGAWAPVVKAGDKVKRGQIIGYIGMTGITSGPHLHFEVLENGQHRDPRRYLPN